MKKKIGLFLLVIFCFMLNPQSALAKSYKCDYDDGLPDESLWIFDRTTSGKPVQFNTDSDGDIEKKMTELINESGEKGDELYFCCPEKKKAWAGNSYKIIITQQCDVWRKKEFVEPTLESANLICSYNFQGVDGNDYEVTVVKDINNNVKFYDRTTGASGSQASLAFGGVPTVRFAGNNYSNKLKNQFSSGTCPSNVKFIYAASSGGYLMTSQDDPSYKDYNQIPVDSPSGSQGTICTDEQLQPIKDELQEQYRKILYDPIMANVNQFKEWQPDLSQIEFDQLASIVNDKFDSLIGNPYNQYSDTLSSKMNEIEKNGRDNLKNAALSCIPKEDTNLQKDVNQLKNVFRSYLYNQVAQDKIAELVKLMKENGITDEDIKNFERELKDHAYDVKEQLDDLDKKLEEEHQEFLTSLSILGSDATISCDGLLGPDLLNDLHKYFGYLKIAAPILLIVMGGVDFGQAVLSDDKEALQKAGSRFIKRVIACAALFFLPFILEEVLKYVDKTGIDPLCGIGKK